MTEKKTLKQALKAHYQQIKLDDEQRTGLDHLQRSYQPKQETADSPSPAPEEKGSRRSLSLAIGLFSVLLVGFVSGHLLSKYHYQKQLTEHDQQVTHNTTVYNTNQLIRDIAEEITFNHRKLKPLELKTNHFEELVSYFDMLDFRPYHSHLFKPQGTLIGGRYCSIGTVSAVQIRYQTEQGDVTTLFQTTYNPEHFKGLPNIEAGDQPVTQYLNGYKVTLWIEMGIVMASVSSPD
ncbi:hypothetical protein ACFOEK_16750 [Litoribrevibacter euphylliae]|uniref:Uncharacterized protein n=1 Tax=Litoribrevibacter euphylliae TaxID=1834034 RepID=A0ABV7HFS0_9GAMM